MPQECIDAFVGFLQAIEPVVEDFDFDNASIDDFEAMGTELEACRQHRLPRWRASTARMPAAPMKRPSPR